MIRQSLVQAVTGVLMLCAPWAVARAQTLSFEPVMYFSDMSVGFGQRPDGSFITIGTPIAQTFTALAPYLESFSFWVAPVTPFPMRFYLTRPFNVTQGFTSEWLYRTGPFELSAGEQKITFTPGAVELTPGETFWAVLRPELEQITPETHPRGVFMRIGTPCPTGACDYYPGHASLRWEEPFVDEASSSGHFAFEAVFSDSVVPEPASVALVATGLVGLIGRVRRREVAQDPRDT